MVVETNLHLGKGIVRGDQFPIHRNVPGVPAGVTIVSAGLTLRTETGALLFEKLITTTNVSGTGYVENTGTSGIGRIRFDLLAANTLAMISDTEYSFDIQVGLSNGDIYTLERGITGCLPEITVAP